MQGVVSCARFAFSPDIKEDAEPLYQYILDKKDDAMAKTILKKYSVYTFLRLISGKIQSDAFDPSVVEAYWIGNGLLEHVGSEELGLVIKNYGFAINKDVDRLLYLNMQLPADKHLAPHHSLSVFLGTLRLHTFSSEVLGQMNDSLITWGMIKEVHAEELIVVRAKLAKSDAYFITEDKVESISYDPAFVGPVQQDEHVAIHHNMAIMPLSLLQTAALKKYTEKTVSVFNRL